MLRKKGGIQLAAEWHQLRLDALQSRCGSERAQHFGQQRLRGLPLRALRRYEQPADQSLVVLEDVKSIAGRPAVLDRGKPAERARVDEFPDEIDRGTVVPVQLFPPVPGFFLEEVFQ